MTLRVSGKNMNIGEALREHVTDRLEATAGKFFEGSIQGHVTIAPDGPGFRADCVLSLSSGVSLQADGRAQEPYACFDQAAERLEKRLRRYKSRLKDQKHGHSTHNGADNKMVANYVLEALDEEAEAPAEGDFNPTIIAESTTRLAQLSIAAAVIELDLTGAAVLPFLHAATGRVNVIYRRSDGNIGWLDPAADGAHKSSPGTKT